MESWDDPVRLVFSMKMDGGRSCLDLLNTLIPAVPLSTHTRTDEPQDLLESYSDLVALAVRTASLSSGEAETLMSVSSKNPTTAKDTLSSAKAFRSLLRRLLIKSSRGIAPATRDLAAFEEIRTYARSFDVLVWENGRFLLRSRYAAEGLTAAQNAFVRDADELIRSRDLSRVRVIRMGSPDARFVLG